MSYVTPNTDLRILANVPLSVQNEHSIAFANNTLQELYFFSKTKYIFSELTYQREMLGRIRVEKNAEDLYDCNYLMFRNTAFGTKWFYAFITHVEYVSNNVSEINYVIDYLQTWLFDYTYKDCFIKRTHTKFDVFGASLTPEPFAIDDYVYGYYKALPINTKDLAVIIGVSDVSGTQVDGNIYDELYTGVTLYAFEMTNETAINTFLGSYKQTPDNVVVMYAIPKILVELIQGFTYGQPIPKNQQGFSVTVSPEPLTLTETLDGYLPKNKKLYTYPYNFLRIDNGSQQTLTLRYELFTDVLNGINLAVDGTFINPPELMLTPTRYRNTTANLENDDVLTMNGYPMLSWNNNTFKSWLSTNWIGLGKQIAGFGLTMLRQGNDIRWNRMGDIASMLKSAIVTGIPLPDKPFERIQRRQNETLDMANTALGGLDIVNNVYQHSKEADKIRGDIVNSNTLIAVGRKQYHEARVCLRHEQAEIIDNFFTMYGYSIDKIGTPDRINRPHWTYIQTANCLILGNVPADAKAYIESIHNRGITWWTNGDEIGDYSLDNSPTGNNV